MKKLAVFMLLFACGDLEESEFVEECKVQSELYSHSVLYCNGYEPENIEDVFEVCNPRQPWSERNPCVTCDIMEFEEGCELQHVCFVEKAGWE